MKILFKPLLFLIPLFLLLFLLNSCDPNVTNTPPSTPESSISELKSASSYTKYIGKEVSIKGFLIYTRDNGAILLSDPNLMNINKIFNQKDYVRIEDASVGKYLTGKENEYFGAEVQMTITVQESKNAQVLAMKDMLGSESIVELVMKELPKIINERKNGNPPIAVDLCQIHPDVCGTVWQTPSTHYALLYSGGCNRENAHIRYWNDIKFMYNTLKKYGYTDDRIVVVYRDGIHDDPLTFVPSVTVDYAATPQGINNAFAYLGSKLDANDQLFVFTTNHGGGFHVGENRNYGTMDTNGDEIDMYNIDEDFCYYGGGTLTDDVLASKINALSVGTVIACLEPCFSGGFLKDLAGNNRVIMSAANEFEFSWSDIWGNYDIFSFHFTSALNGYEPRNLIDTPKVDADFDHDGKVTFLEAFQYAKSKDGSSEHPQYEDSGDGIGTESPTSTGTDGSLGAGLSL